MEYDYYPTLTKLSDKTKPSLPPRHRSVNGEYSNSISPYLPNIKGKNMGDYWNEDVHMLIDTNSSITYPELRNALGDISVGDYQEVYDKAQVCKYVTKHIDKGVDYELTFRHNIPSN